ncbi:MAG TPA: rhamnulokinase [Candidatus Aminicenantes bacterium]|nr:rhamnulokinase [Candidatus Aminicenantes bacterium]
METRFFLAFDLGAESGRAILGRLENGRILTRELSRFPNVPVQARGHLHWNVDSLFQEIKKGMTASLAEAGTQPESLAVDTWGVDFGLLSPDGTLLGLPYAYRDARTRGLMEEFFELLPRNEIYERTGIQFLPFNTLFQLFAAIKKDPDMIGQAGTLLFMPDLFNFLLTGKKANEFTIASTSQLLDPRTRAWDEMLLSVLGIPLRIMQQIVFPGTLLGALSAPVSRETGLHRTPVIATASHDTAAAIAAVPASGEDWAYISSGTWSLMGVELGFPLINAEVLSANFTNEGGIAGSIRFLKNIAGLWLLQQCRKEWASGRTLSYEELTGLVGEASPFGAFVDPDCPDFMNPPSMVEAIRSFCLGTGQKPPRSPAKTARCILESLALKYRWTLDELRRLTGKSINKIHVIGGGSRNEQLCQFTADATSLPVFSGPAEATAIGNIMTQALAIGQVGSVGEIRAVVRDSVDIKAYRPERPAEWDRAYGRFREVLGL